MIANQDFHAAFLISEDSSLIKLVTFFFRCYLKKRSSIDPINSKELFIMSLPLKSLHAFTQAVLKISCFFFFLLHKLLENISQFKLTMLSHCSCY